jgi:hypothetical protein
VLAGTATAAPKRRDGIVESFRAVGTARRGAVKARTAAINQLKALLVTAPASLREALDGRSTPTLVATSVRLRPDQTALTDPVHGCKAALGVVAQRIQLLNQEITLADQRLATLGRQHIGHAGCCEWSCNKPRHRGGWYRRGPPGVVGSVEFRGAGSRRVDTHRSLAARHGIPRNGP